MQADFKISPMLYAIATKQINSESYSVLLRRSHMTTVHTLLAVYIKGLVDWQCAQQRVDFEIVPGHKE